uniref:NAD-dependent epimerase/dehydratase domain-containing protein n=1 Tax=Sus scrofa TaxID=9823 RepID=A0A4X1V5V1_PIG
MKPTPAGSSPEACKAAGQGEPSCPVCQARGGVSAPKPESGPGLGPGAVSRPALGPAVVLEPGSGPIAVSRPGLGPGSVSGPGSGPGTIPGPGVGSGAVSGPGTVLGPGPGPSVVLEPGSRPGAASGPGPGPGAVSGPGLGPGPGPAPGPSLAVGPGPAAGSVPASGAAPLPGPRRGSGTGHEPSEPITAPTPAPQQKTQVTPVLASRQKVLVTGGGGYLGFTLGSSLAKSGISVILLDLRRPQWELCPGTEFIQADVRDAEALHQAFEGVDCVFHVASYGMSGAEKFAFAGGFQGSSTPAPSMSCLAGSP